MTTSRTGTSTYLRNRGRVLRQAQRDGLTHCPGVPGRTCGVQLDYAVPLTPASAETDHIVEHRQGGSDDVDNLRVICRTCNLWRNRKQPVAIPSPEQFPTSRDW